MTVPAAALRASVLVVLFGFANTTFAAAVEEILITAQKRQESLMDVPQSVQAFDTAFIENNNVRDLVDAVNFIPGASASFSGGAGSQLYNMRGTGAQGRIGQIAIGFYIDDIPWIGGGPFGPPIRLFDLESLQVLRGPQGTLYGQGSMGGTFVINTSQPDMSQFTARGKAQYFTMEEGDETTGADATVSIPIIQDRLALRLTGGFANNTGLAETPDLPGEDDIDDYDQRDFRAKLRWEPSDTLAITTTFWHTQEDRNFSPGIYASVDPPLITGTGGIVGDVEQETALYSVLIDWETPLGRFTSATGYINNEGIFDSAFAFDTFIPGLGLVNSVLQLTVPASTKNWNEEIRLTSTGDGPTQWIVGGTYTEQNGINTVLSAFIEGFLTFIPDSISANDGLSQSWSVFGELSHEFFDGKLTPLVGLRYYKDDVESNSIATGVVPFHVNETFDAVSPRFNLKYQPTDDAQIYLNIAKGFRSGVFNTPTQRANAAGLGIILDEALDESTLWSYEIGGRFDLIDGTLRIEPALYYVDYQDYQFEGSVGNINFDLLIDQVEGVGVDLLITYIPAQVEGLALTVVGDYNETEPTDLQSGVTAQVPALAEDEQMPFVPKWSYTLQADYEMPIGESGLTGFGTVSWYTRATQVDFITGLTSRNPQDLTLRLGVRKDLWSLSIWGQNVTDDHGPAVIAGGLENRYDRRMVGVTLTAELGE